MTPESPRSPRLRTRALAGVAACASAALLATVAGAPGASAVRAPIDPLTGVASTTMGPLVAVKVANTPPGRPQSGLRSADQIWVEEQEGGWTRFVALYGSSYPAKVGPVRSGRETDLQLLDQFGRPGLAYAGADVAVAAAIRTSGAVVDLGASDNGLPIRPTAYGTDPKRVMPYNYYARTPALRAMAAAAGATKPRPMGFTFGKPKAPGKKVRAITAVWSKNATMASVWSSKLKAFVMYADGKVLIDRESGKPLTAANVVVMRVTYTISKLDHSQYPVPVLRTVGKGAATVLRSGSVWTGTWTRTSAATGTALRDAKGRTITLSPGQTWVLLVPLGKSLRAPVIPRAVVVR